MNITAKSDTLVLSELRKGKEEYTLTSNDCLSNKLKLTNKSMRKVVTSVKLM